MVWSILNIDIYALNVEQPIVIMCIENMHMWLLSSLHTLMSLTCFLCYTIDYLLGAVNGKVTCTIPYTYWFGKQMASEWGTLLHSGGKLWCAPYNNPNATVNICDWDSLPLGQLSANEWTVELISMSFENIFNMIKFSKTCLCQYVLSCENENVHPTYRRSRICCSCVVGLLYDACESGISFSFNFTSPLISPSLDS